MALRERGSVCTWRSSSSIRSFGLAILCVLVVVWYLASGFTSGVFPSHSRTAIHSNSLHTDLMSGLPVQAHSRVSYDMEDDYVSEEFILNDIRKTESACLRKDPVRLRQAYLKHVSKYHNRNNDGTIKERQKKRQRSTQAACKKHSNSSILLLPDQARKLTLKHIIVDDMHRMLYCFIPKTSCSNWKAVFKVLQEREAWPGCYPLNHKRDVQTLDMFGNEEIEHRLKTYYKFTFAREPLERLYSAYRDKFGQKRTYKGGDFFHRVFGAEIVRAYRNASAQKSNESLLGLDIAWREFTQFVADRHDRARWMDDHWMRLENICRPCSIQYDFIGHYEQLEEESNYILRERNVDSRVFFPPRQLWYQSKNLSKESHLSQLTPQLQLKLRDIYRHSYELFGYSTPHG